MNKPTLYIMCGLSGSGKSTIATQIANENPSTVIVSGNYADQEHNEEVFRIFHDRIRRNLKNKRNVIVDAANLTLKARRAIMNNVNVLDIDKICYITAKPFVQCKKDNLNREHPVPEEVLSAQIRRSQVPFYEEGFDKIIVSRNAEWYRRYTKTEFLKMMRGYDQKTPFHTMDLLNHCLSSCNSFGKYFNVCDEFFDGFVTGAELHDLGKLFTQTFDDDGIAHYYGHAEYGSYSVLSQINVPETWSYDDLLNCCFLINYHMFPFEWNTEKIKKRWKERFGEYKYKMLLDFNECDKARRKDELFYIRFTFWT